MFSVILGVLCGWLVNSLELTTEDTLDHRSYNPFMGGLIQPAPTTEQSESNWRPILLGVALVMVVVGVIAVLLREAPKNTNAPHPYAANIKLSDLKMSAAENFVGASVTYLDGTVINSGDKTATHAIVHLTFKDSLGQIVQTEDIPLHVLQTSGPYPEAVDLTNSPLTPGQSRPFRLTLEHVSNDWNHEYPALQVTDVVVR